MAAIQIDGVIKRYGGRMLFDRITLSIDSGCFVALVGPSGSGKTTLLKTINRLVEADAGEVRLDGSDVRRSPVHELRRRIGYVLQATGLFPHMSVADNIAVPLRLRGAGRDARLARAGEMLRLVGLDESFLDRRPRSLSGGQAQRVGVARALAAAPEIMLMDEPFGALDPITRDELGRAYRALHERLGLTTVMVTHDMTEALLLADRIVVLIDGRISADAPPSGLLTSDLAPEVRRLLDVPRRQAARLAALGAIA